MHNAKNLAQLRFGEKLVGHRQPRHDHDIDFRRFLHALAKRFDALAIGEAAAAVRDRAHDRGVAVTRRDADDRVALFYHHIAGDEQGGGLAVANHDVVPVRVAAQMREPERVQIIGEQGRRDFIVEQRNVASFDLHAALQPVHDEHAALRIGGETRAHRVPRGLELGEIVGRR